MGCCRSEGKEQKDGADDECCCSGEGKGHTHEEKEDDECCSGHEHGHAHEHASEDSCGCGHEHGHEHVKLTPEQEVELLNNYKKQLETELKVVEEEIKKRAKK